MLDRYPNFYIDTAARVPEIGRHDHFVIDTAEGRRLALNDARRFGSLDLDTLDIVATALADLRDHNRCQYCGRKFPSSELSLDHVVPISRGGKSTWENVVCACLPCNVRKGNKLLSECGIQLKRPPVRPRWHPLHRLQGRTYPEIWKNFLDAAYWNVELKE